MDKSNKIYIAVVALTVLVAATVFFAVKAPSGQAGAGDNVSGYAWSENIGWVGLNCTNSDSCGSSNYGVKVDGGGRVSGYAWAETVGWISFSSADLSGCPSGACEAQLNHATGEVSGWARACAGTAGGDCTGGSRSDGWDGWIRLRGTAGDGSPYGVSVTECNWDGYAWGSDVVGWIHFKGANYGVVGSGDGCTSSNHPPRVSPDSPQAPSDYCVLPFGWVLSWRFSDPDGGDAQSAYQIIITDTSTGTVVKDTSQVSSGSGSYAIPLGTLEFNKTYSWTIKVWDSNPSPLTDQASGSNFTTILHAAPAVSFTWTPTRPAKEEQVTFTDATVVSGGATIQSWQWTFPAGATLFTPTNAQQAVAKFSESGTKIVELAVTDSDGLVCTKRTDQLPPGLNVGRGVPRLKEIVPR